MDLAHFWNTSGAYQINQSLRFDGSAYLNRTPASAGNRRTSTFSCWFKWVSTGGEGVFLWASGRTKLAIDGGGSDEVSLDDYDGSYNIRKITSQSLRDPSAWYHLMVVMDTTNATAEDRQRLYLNGQRITAFSTSTNPSQNFDTEWNNNVEHRIGADNNPFYFRGYMAECYMVDGTALTPSSFGETDTITGAWIPKKYSGSYGTNGFYLKFDPSATNGIGHDHSGNGNNFTATGFSTSGTGTDVMSDTPTNNYATLNPIFKENTGVGGGTFANGNLEHSESGISFRHTVSTQALPSSGKVYVEVESNTVASSYGAIFGLMLESKLNAPDDAANFIIYCESNGSLSIEGTSQGTHSAGDVFSLSVDMNASPIEIVVRKNGTVVGTNPYTLSTTETLFFWSRNIYGSKLIWNFGQRAFAYTPPTGFKALNTANLPEPTIKDGGKHFDTVLYTGNSTVRSITGLDFQPGFVWFKNRSLNGYNHQQFDAVRGATKVLRSSSTGAEYTDTTGLTSFDASGFSLGANNDETNLSGSAFVAWNWKANGAGSSNTAGTITSTVSANATAGFSIVTYSANNTAGATFGHGLGVAPSMVIVKKRNAVERWVVYHKSISNQYIYLNETFAGETANAALRFGNDSSVVAPSSTLVTIGTHNDVNGASGTYVAYCFSEVAGYSKFGSYTGNGLSGDSAPFVWCGFRPRWVLLKSTSSGSWELYDTARDTYNQSEKTLEPNSSAVEGSGYPIDVLSNGFKVRTSNSQINYSSYSYIFAAFAELPFKYANAR